MDIFYDIEVFRHDALIVLKDENKRLIRAMWNRFEGLLELIEGHRLIAYNGYHYDDYILSRMLMGDRPEELKRLNDRIIEDRPHTKFIHPAINSLDAFQQIDVSMPGLKMIEGNMGHMILESGVPFDIDRPLTPAERDETLEYCAYDVDELIDVYKMRGTYFKTKEILVDRMVEAKKRPELKAKAMRWNTTTISANLLLDKPLPKWSGIRVPEWMMNVVPAHVKEGWLIKSKNMEGKSKAMTVQELDCDITFSYGGLHGVHRHVKRAKDVILLDVTSMYPNIVINLNVLGHATGLFKELLNERIQAKKAGNWTMSEALKLILNSVYGQLKNKYSTLYNPRASLSVCIYGQIALYDLCKRLHPMATLININTDGVAFTADSDEYKSIVADWEEDYGLKLEEKRYKTWIQKDVNNYIAVPEDPSKDIVLVGGDVGKALKNQYFRNNSTRIVDLAILKALLEDQDPITTIMEHRDEPIMFQYILRAGGTYKGICDTEGRPYQKINRVFATKGSGVQLQKLRQDGGLVRFPDAPDKMLIHNEDLEALENFDKILDINHYYQLIRHKLKGWGA